jgi:NitT/TauT family transport system substrate-binding protein
MRRNIVKDSQQRKAGILKRMAALFCLLVVGTLGCNDGKPPAMKQPIAKVTMGIQVSPAMTLVMVAKDKDFFSQEGVDVDLKEFTAGKFALQAFLSNSIDFAVSGEVPVCLASLQGNQIRVVTQVVENTVKEVRVVALKDGELTDPAAYFKAKKRKLATSFGGGPEFFTYTFLRHHQISEDQVEIISQKPEDMPAALETGSVDAISVFDPFAFIAEKRLGSKAQTFADPSLYSEFYVLNAHPEQIEKSPETIQAIVNAFGKASAFIEKNPEESKEIMRKYTKLDREIIDGIWQNFVFRPALVQKLITYWNDEALWAKNTGKVKPDTKIPDFRGVVEDRFLKAASPSSVKL